MRRLHDCAPVRLPLLLMKRHWLPAFSAIAIRTRLIPPAAVWPRQRKSIVRPTSLIVVVLAWKPLREIELRGGDGEHDCAATAPAPSTVVLCEAESFEWSGSPVVELTVAMSVICPGLAGFTTTAICALAPSPSDPSA